MKTYKIQIAIILLCISSLTIAGVGDGTGTEPVNPPVPPPIPPSSNDANCSSDIESNNKVGFFEQILMEIISSPIKGDQDLEYSEDTTTC